MKNDEVPSLGAAPLPLWEAPDSEPQTVQNPPILTIYYIMFLGFRPLWDPQIGQPELENGPQKHGKKRKLEKLENSPLQRPIKSGEDC